MELALAGFTFGRFGPSSREDTMRDLLFAVVAAWGAMVLLCSWADPHCDGAHARECAAEYGLFQRCTLGLDDR